MKKSTRRIASLMTGVAALGNVVAGAEVNVSAEARTEETYDEIANVNGDFAFDQNVITPADEVFSLFGTVATGICAKPGFAMDKVEREDHYVNIGGKVKKETSFTLDELEKMKSETRNIVCSCGSSNAAAQIQITGVPLSAVAEMAGLESDANTVTVKSPDGYGIAMPLQYVLDHKAMLVYKINNEVLPYEAGGLQLYMPYTVAKYFTRQVTEIELSKEETVPEVQQMPDDLRAKVSIVNRMAKDEFAPGDRLVFEGYADDCGKAITALQFSMDNGKTWTTYETEGATPDKWVYWYFGYVTEAAGTYKLDVRAVAEDGTVSPLGASTVFTVK